MEQPQPPLKKGPKNQATIVLVFATTIQQPSDIARIKPLLDQCKGILSWNVDMEDWEKILRVKGIAICGEEIIQLLSGTGIVIRELK